MKKDLVKALEYTVRRLSQIPHDYSETDFRMLSDVLKKAEEPEEVFVVLEKIGCEVVVYGVFIDYAVAIDETVHSERWIEKANIT